MGASMSPECSDLKKFDLLKEIETKYKHMDKIKFHKSFRDDGLILFNGTMDEMAEFFVIANGIHPLLKFTYEISKAELPFLDLLIYKGKRFANHGILDLKVYGTKRSL